MDPLTQGVLGATLAQSGARHRQVAAAGLLGLLAGMAADLDVLIGSSSDPLLFLEYHRQFTHSLLFIPLGGLACAVVLHALLRRFTRLTFARSYLFCTLGYATHGVLDACTTYGTVLFWPFSDLRIAWNVVSIIDPLFTLPMLLLVMLAWVERRPQLARIALVWGCCYLLLGLWQRNSALEMGSQLARERGHSPLRLAAKPSFANILLWKIVYQTADRFYVDAVRTGPSPRIYPGDSIAVLDIHRDFPWLDPRSRQARDVERFSWFSAGYVARDSCFSNRVIDIRYSLLPNEINSLWSIELNPRAGPDEHAAYLTHRENAGEQSRQLWRMLSGTVELPAEHRVGGGDGCAVVDSGTLAR